MRILSMLARGLLALCVVISLVPNAACGAGEGAYEVKLVWGTNGQKPKDKNLKDVDPKLLEKLGPFKWKNYFEVSAKTLPVPKDTPSSKLKLSDKCEVQIQDLGNSRIELRLFGEGKPVVKRTQPVVPGEMIIVGGDSSNDTAWFVVLVPPK
jgi:hypothetical protein